MMTNRPAPCGNALAFEVGNAVQRRIGKYQQGRTVGIGFVHRDRLDRCPRSQYEQQRRVADDAGVDGTGIERLGQRRGGGEFCPVNVVGQVTQGVSRFQLGAHVALLIANTQGQSLGGSCLAGQQGGYGEGQQRGSNGHGLPRGLGGRHRAVQAKRL